MIRSIRHFQDVHAHAASVAHWSQLYSQLTAGALESSLQQLFSDRCHVFRERINQRVVQQGEAPGQRVCFAVPIAIPGTARMQGRDADDNSLFFLRGGEEFMFHMPTGMDLLSITFDRAFFDAALLETPFAEEIARLLRQPVIKVPAQRFAECRQRLMAMFSEALVNDELSGTPARQDELEQALLGELVQLVIDPACDRHQRSGSSTQDFIVEKCHRMAMAEMRIRVLPLLACAGLLAVLVLAVGNFHVLTGASRGISAALVMTVPIAAAAGWIAASRLARRDPQRFAALGQDRG